MNRNTITHYGECAVLATALLSAMAFVASAAAATQSSGAPVQPAASAPAPDAAKAPGATSPASKPTADPDELRIKGLHDQLKITPAQDSLWESVPQAMRSNDAKMDALATERHAKASTMTAVEDLRSYGEITEAHATGIKTFIAVFEKLYDNMSATQKVTADNVFRSGGRKTLKSTG